MPAVLKLKGVKYSLNSKDFSDQKIDQDSFCVKNTLQSGGDALEKGSSLTCLQKLSFNPAYECFPHLKSDLLFFSTGKSIVLRYT